MPTATSKFSPHSKKTGLENTRLIEPLFSTKSFGVGLGLPIVKSIMEQHGGGISISSEPGVSTTILWLPASSNN